MNARLLSCIAVLVYAAAVAADELPPVNPQAASEYFLKLRMAYAKSKDYQGSWNADEGRDAVLALQDDDPKQFLAKSAEWLKKCPVDAAMHLIRSSELIKAGDYNGHFYHRMMYYGLTASIMASGDGKSPKTACKVISVDEEYIILRHIGAKLVRQSLQGACDAMEVEIEGKPATIFFDVSISMAFLERQLNPDKAEQKEKEKETGAKQKEKKP